MTRPCAYSLHKEHKSYIVEEEQQKIKLDKFVAGNAGNEEDWDIRNAVRYMVVVCMPASHLMSHAIQRRMLEESNRMIADTSKRLGNAVQELRQLLVRPPYSLRPPCPRT